jgi:hypothetical protein
LFTYGAHSNDKLLVHYGFVCSSDGGHATVDDEIRLDNVILPQLSEAIKSQLQDVGFLGPYALVPSDKQIGSDNGRVIWDICFKTQVAVRAAILTCNEWEYFVTNGEDMTGDQTAAVEEWLRPHLVECRKHVATELASVDKEFVKFRDVNGCQWPVAVSLIRQRWTQIDDAVKSFLGG